MEYNGLANTWIEKILKGKDIVKTIARYGHINRREEHSMLRKIMSRRFGENTSKGRPKAGEPYCREH